MQKRSLLFLRCEEDHSVLRAIVDARCEQSCYILAVVDDDGDLYAACSTCNRLQHYHVSCACICHVVYLSCADNVNHMPELHSRHIEDMQYQSAQL